MWSSRFSMTSEVFYDSDQVYPGNSIQYGIRHVVSCFMLFQFSLTYTFKNKFINPIINQVQQILQVLNSITFGQEKWEFNETTFKILFHNYCCCRDKTRVVLKRYYSSYLLTDVL